MGDTLEFMTPGGNIEYTLDSMVQDRNGEAIQVAPGSGHRVRIPLPENVPTGEITKGLLLRNLEKTIDS